MFIYLNKKGQNTLEYAIVIAVIVSALIVMQIYIKRGFQGKLRSSTDNIGEQYSPTITTGSYTTTTGSTSGETIATGVTTTDVTRGTQGRTGSETVAVESSEVWP